MKSKEELSKMLVKHCSQRYSNLHTVIELIERGADVNFIEEGETCLSNMCCKFKGMEQNEYFDDNLSILKILLEHGADPNFKVTTPDDHLYKFPENGFPCFFSLFSKLLSPHKNLVNAMELLIKFDANLNVQDKSGDTLLDRIFYNLGSDIVLFKSVLKVK